MYIHIYIYTAIWTWLLHVEMGRSLVQIQPGGFLPSAGAVGSAANYKLYVDEELQHVYLKDKD